MYGILYAFPLGNTTIQYVLHPWSCKDSILYVHYRLCPTESQTYS